MVYANEELDDLFSTIICYRRGGDTASIEDIVADIFEYTSMKYILRMTCERKTTASIAGLIRYGIQYSSQDICILSMEEEDVVVTVAATIEMLQQHFLKYIAKNL